MMYIIIITHVCITRYHISDLDLESNIRPFFHKNISGVVDTKVYFDTFFHMCLVWYCFWIGNVDKPTLRVQVLDSVTL